MNNVKTFKNDNPILYKQIIEEYQPVTDRYIAINMYQANIAPPRCVICDKRITVSKHYPTRCKLHTNTDPDAIYDYNSFCVKFPGSYIKWEGYKSKNDKITIICDMHGSYEQVVSSRINGHGCQQCYFYNKIGKFSIDTDQYLKEFILRHGTKYDYSKTVFNGSEGRIEILCPNHGSFMQQANVHKAGHGCTLCAAQASSNRQSTDECRALSRIRQATYIKNNSNKSKDTKPELKCKSFLDGNKILFEHQYILTDAKYGAWTYDFYVKDKNLLIETDGEYFHRMPAVFNRDKIKNRIAEKYGFILLRLSDLNLDFSLINSDIDKIRLHTLQIMIDRENYIKDKL
jgi:very-short-patch-repair endonuclease